MYLLIDNYDSFTYNLWHYLEKLGAEVEVVRNDALSAEDAIAKLPQGIILSPGPCDPERAGICLSLTALAAEWQVPLFGVCLGHQTIGRAFGGKVVRAPEPMHGKVCEISHRGSDVFTDIPSPFQATRYHSLLVERSSLPARLTVTAESPDGLIMGLAHAELPIFGVQFHPESITSQYGHQILKNFLTLAASA